MSRASVEPIAAELKAARVAKKLSQRLLGAKTGMPQSQISNIESGRVDLATSSLIELARALDLELMLVPRGLGPAVRSLLRSSNSATDQQRTVRNAAAHSAAAEKVSSPAYTLDDVDDDDGDG